MAALHLNIEPALRISCLPLIRIPECHVTGLASGVDIAAGLEQSLGIFAIDRLQGFEPWLANHLQSL